jgi:hypothetical protein
MLDIDPIVLSAKKYNWFSDDGITDSASTIQKDGIVEIVDHIKKSQWKEFESALEGTSQSLIVITQGVPQEWIGNKKLNVIQTQSYTKRLLSKIDKNLKNWRVFNRFTHFHRNSSSLDYDYFLMYGRWEYHRETLVKELESRSVLIKSLYSRPKVGDRPGRSIENHTVHAPIESRFNHLDNFDMVIKNSQRCCCSVVLENNGLLAESDRTITEKSIWPILAQVPFVWAVAPNKVQQLTEWGFRANDPPRHDLRSLTEQLMWLRSGFDNPDTAQRWQDDQGEIINHNLTILRGLADRIDEDTHRQLRQLGLS